MIQLNLPELKALSSSLQKYDFKNTVSQFAGLLTVPSLQANTVRIDLLVHLATIHCNGKRRARLEQINIWLNKSFEKSNIPFLEDPVENVFISNIATPEGNFRIFEGIWESNDYFLQAVIDTLNGNKRFQDLKELIEPSFALLRLSDCIAERLNLERWHSDESAPQGTVNIRPKLRIIGRARAITFTREDLESIGVSRKSLDPFILPQKDRDCLREEIIGNSSLERYPLIDFGEELVFALPHAASPAVRRFVLTFLRQIDHLNEFGKVLFDYQFTQIEREVLKKIQIETGIFPLPKQFKPPEPDARIPSLHSCLYKYDIDKYIHIVLLHDRLDYVESQGLISMMEYPDNLNTNLSKYLFKVSKTCRELADCSMGTTLFIMGGLGRGLIIKFNQFPNGWDSAIVSISDLLMLARQPGKPITKFLKCFQQKRWVEMQGIYFLNVNGDYNFYCFWRRHNYQLIPRDLRIENRNTIVIENDYVLPVRREIRKLIDHHAAKTTDSSYRSVTRFNIDSFFKSVENRPIYGSIEHFRKGIMAAVVETSRAAYWLVLKSSKSDKKNYLLYELWVGFLELFDKLVSEFETRYPIKSENVFEIRLNFEDVDIPEYFSDMQSTGLIEEPEFTFYFNQQVVEIKFPTNILFQFAQPENSGEYRSTYFIAIGLLCLYHGVLKLELESEAKLIVDSVLGDSGARVLHVFHSYDPIEILLATQHKNSLLNLALEDFVFSKLGLTNDCVTQSSSSVVETKSKCKKILNNVVDKVWKRLRKLLSELNRESVISKTLKLHESLLGEREQWNRTSKALLALRGSNENVVKIAENRELERTRFSLAARSLLEMAVCECPESGGRPLSRWDLDKLLANVLLLLEAATDSDAFHKNLIHPPEMEIHPNGEYTIDRSYKETIVEPFFAAYHQDLFESRVNEYPDLYQTKIPTQKTKVGGIFPDEFLIAFQAEFGLSVENAFDGFATLFDFAVEKNSIVVSATLGEIFSKMSEFKDLPLDVCQKFIHTFSIFHRPKWEVPPNGFNRKDIYPWRYRRRLSATTRPILAFGECMDDKVIYGIGSIRRGFLKIFHELKQGKFPNELFNSEEMKKYVGKMNDRLGHEFTKRVAKILDLQGWRTCIEVQMTQFGAQPKLGDIDVLAWNDTGQVQIIECKRLHLARNVAKIAENLDRFRGDSEDELDKHITRFNWFKANPASLYDTIGFVPKETCIDCRLVTSTRVPIQYIHSLPIPAEKITPIVEL